MNRIEEIRAGLKEVDPELSFTIECGSLLVEDMSYLLTQLDKCKKALEFYEKDLGTYSDHGVLARTTLKEVWPE